MNLDAFSQTREQLPVIDVNEFARTYQEPDALVFFYAVMGFYLVALGIARWHCKRTANHQAQRAYQQQIISLGEVRHFADANSPINLWLTFANALMIGAVPALIY